VGKKKQLEGKGRKGPGLKKAWVRVENFVECVATGKGGVTHEFWWGFYLFATSWVQAREGLSSVPEVRHLT